MLPDCSWSICHIGKKPKQQQIIQKWSEMTNIKEALAVPFQKPRPGVSREWEEQKQFAPQKGRTFSDCVKYPWCLHLKFSSSHTLFLSPDPPGAAPAESSPNPKPQHSKDRTEQSFPLQEQALQKAQGQCGMAELTGFRTCYSEKSRNF